MALSSLSTFVSLSSARTSQSSELCRLGVACISHSPFFGWPLRRRRPFSSISFTFPLRPPLSAEYPWQVAILKKEEFDNVYLCGGSLIDGSHIVTAAHCVDDFKPNELR